MPDSRHSEMLMRGRDAMRQDNSRREINAINTEHYPTGFPPQGIIQPPSPPTHSFSSKTLQTGQSPNPTTNARRGQWFVVVSQANRRMSSGTKTTAEEHLDYK